MTTPGGDDSPPTWRYALYTLETDDKPESTELFQDVITFVKGGEGQGGALTPRQKGRYSLLTRDDLSQIASSKQYTGPDNLCEALDSFVRQEEQEGLMKKTLQKQREQQSCGGGGGDGADKDDGGIKGLGGGKGTMMTRRRVMIRRAWRG